MRAWRAFLEAHAAVARQLERELLAETSLPLGWYDVLVQLNEAPGRRLRMHELASAVLLSRSGLTRLVERMERASLVTRNTHPSDGRGTVAVLTDAGRAQLRRCAPTHLRGVDEHFLAHLDDGELDVIAGALERVAAAQRSSAAPPRRSSDRVAATRPENGLRPRVRDGSRTG